MKNVAVITGGSSGIGKAISIEMAKTGFEVVVVYAHDDSKADDTCLEISTLGGSVRKFKADVANEKDVKMLANFIEQTYGKLDVLVNNAGIYQPARIEDASAIDVWDTTLDINLRAKFLCSKNLVSLLKKSSYGSIINISSRAASRPMDESIAYCCAAAGITMLTKVSALEFAPYHIRVNAINPGLTRTPMTERVDTEEDFIRYANANPSGRMGTPLDVANLAVFLASEDASLRERLVNFESLD